MQSTRKPTETTSSTWETTTTLTTASEAEATTRSLAEACTRRTKGFTEEMETIRSS